MGCAEADLRGPLDPPAAVNSFDSEVFMHTAHAATDYVLGNTDAEHERLTRQARTLEPYTERLFRDAGLGRGQRVLDIGCGVGDVALLAASLVGETGQVIGVDRDAVALAKARSRAGARTTNVRFVETDLADLQIDGDFDAIVGRFILMFLPDPIATLRSLARRLRAGGVMVFQEPSWNSFFCQTKHLPLRTACGEVLCEAFSRAGAQPNMELTLFRGMLESGFEAPQVRVEIPMANNSDGRRWVYDLLMTMRPRLEDFGIASDTIGDFGTLAERLEAELEAARSYAPLVGLAGAWARKTQ
jgi:SAM-dependent methyltransferase